MILLLVITKGHLCAVGDNDEAFVVDDSNGAVCLGNNDEAFVVGNNDGC